MRDASRLPTDLLTVSIWFGIVAGAGEGVIHALQGATFAVFPVAVILYLCLYALLGVGFSALSRYAPPSLLLLPSWSLYVGLTVYDWVRVAFPYSQTRLLAQAGALGLTLAGAWIVHRHQERVVRLHRGSLAWIACGALLAILALPAEAFLQEKLALSRHAGPARPGPNVLLIVVDTLRADHLSVYGYRRETSPNIDRLAAQGVTFEKAVATSSWTLPSHVSMFTGRDPYEHGAGATSQRLDTRFPTIAETAQAGGYRTAGFSANQFFFSRLLGLQRGFLHFEDNITSPGGVQFTFYGSMIELLFRNMHWRRDMPGRKSAAEINASLLKWIDSDQRPFFAALNYYDVHDPYLPSPSYFRRFSVLPEPPGRVAESYNWFPDLTAAELQAEKDAYDASIAYVDEQVGRLIEELEKRGLRNNTVVLLTSDHGEAFGEHRLVTHANGLYWELIHVPLIVSQPGHISSGVRVSMPITTASLAATMQTIMLGNPGPFPGRSLTELWSSQTRTGSWPMPRSELEIMKFAPMFPNYYASEQSVVTPQWHYILSSTGRELLYPCCGSAEETRDLSASIEEGASVRASLQGELRRRTAK